MEKWNAYTRDGKLTDKILIRGEKIPEGLYFMACEVLVRHVDGDFLCMRRSGEKVNFGGYLEATAGGAALLGEDRYQCVKRELREETGLECEQFLELGSYVSDVNRSIFYSFACTVDCKKDAVQIQEGETEGYVWMSEGEFIAFVNSGEMIPPQYERHLEYFKKLGYIKEGAFMKYRFFDKVRQNDTVREAFNELTRQTFGFDFGGWYEAGQWGDFYVPHVLLDEEKVVSNVSVNRMQFDMGGMKKNFIQLGTVMTDSAYRGQGLNRKIMEHIMEEYKDKVDGIYLFGNDEVVNYYPKYGFKPAIEYEYYLKCEHTAAVVPYTLEKIDMQDSAQAEKFYDYMRTYKVDAKDLNQNDAMYMSENVNLFQFWLGAGYGDSVYYLPEMDVYAILEVDGDRVLVCQIFGKEEVDVLRLAKAVCPECTEVVLGYTPVGKEPFCVREHKEDDCTLFILGEDLACVEQKMMMFPLLSHA